MSAASPAALRALVVEDDRSWQAILAELLQDAGLFVDVAASYATALPVLRAAAHRVAVVDLSLGGVDHHNRDGLRVLAALQKHDPACTAVLLTGFATVEIAVSAMKEYGAYTSLRKETFRRSQFRALLREMLADAGSREVGERIDAGRSDGSGEPVASGGAQVLVVEDDAGWQAIYLELLSDSGHLAQPCRSYGEAIGLFKRRTFALAIVDLSLASSATPTGNVDGLRVLETCRAAGVPAIVISGRASPRDAERVYEEFDAFAFIEKQTFSRRAFRQTVADALDQAATPSPLDCLTGREREVFDLLALGLTNKQIAARLVISPNTVKRHMKAIFAKLEVNTRAAAVAKGTQNPGRWSGLAAAGGVGESARR
jgi:DNA-binding NarL/FixJ family response regulator